FKRSINPTSIPTMADDIVNGSLGFKFATGNGFMVVANALVPLNRGGLRANITYTTALEDGFLASLGSANGHEPPGAAFFSEAHRKGDRLPHCLAGAGHVVVDATDARIGAFATHVEPSDRQACANRAKTVEEDFPVLRLRGRHAGIRAP